MSIFSEKSLQIENLFKNNDKVFFEELHELLNIYQEKYKDILYSYKNNNCIYNYIKSFCMKPFQALIQNEELSIKNRKNDSFWDDTKVFFKCIQCTLLGENNLKKIKTNYEISRYKEGINNVSFILNNIDKYNLIHLDLDNDFKLNCKCVINFLQITVDSERRKKNIDILIIEILENNKECLNCLNILYQGIMKLLKIEEDILNKAYVALNKINIICQDNDIIDNDIIDNYRYFNYIKQHCEENTEKYKEFLKKIDKDILNLIKKKEDLLNLIHPDNDFTVNDFKLCLDNAIQYVEENLKRTNEFTLIADYIENLEEKKRNKKFILISANKFKILEEKLKN